MKSLPKLVKTLFLVVAASTCAFAANAATYYTSITSGSDYVDYWMFQTQTNLAGKPLTINITDNFEYITIDYGHSTYQSGWYKTATLSGSVYVTNKLYSSDGINFSYDYSGLALGSSARANAVLTGATWTFSAHSQNPSLEQTTSYVAPVPIPGAAWLFGSSLMALAARRISKQS